MKISERIDVIKADSFEEKKRLQALYLELGTNYYRYVAAGNNYPKELYKDIKAVSDSLTKISQNEQEVARLQNAPACPTCGFEIENGAAFCFNCGTKVREADANSCKVCGTKLNPGATFCHICGTKVEAPQVEEVAEVPAENIKKCSSCGAVLSEDDMFCINCGARIAPLNTAERKCPRCGNTVEADHDFCINCGSHVD
ncbi:MAG: zinc ribbon domain-containing protein [Ruminococcaceae bacterium]|nr:zinc ribbon domain-containing protein [Oscillospiraceae bacterium]